MIPQLGICGDYIACAGTVRGEFAVVSLKALEIAVMTQVTFIT